MPDRHDSHDHAHEPASHDAATHANPLCHALALLRGRYHWAVLLAVMLGIGGAMAGSRYVEPEYRSTAKLRIAPELRSVLYDTDVTGRIPQYDAYLDAQINYMLSLPVIERAMEHEAWRRLGRADFPAAVFRGRLEIDHSRRTEIVQLRYRDPAPEAAAAGVQAMVDTYIQLYRQRQHGEDERIQHTLEDRRDALRRQLTWLDQQRGQVVGNHGSEGIRQRYGMTLNDISRVDMLMRQARLQVQSMRERAEAGPEDLTDMSPEQLAARSPEIAQMLDQRQLIERFISRQQRLGRGPNHRSVVRARSELEALNEQIAELTHALRTGQMPLVELEGQEPDILGLGRYASIEQVEARLDDLAQVRQRLEDDASALATRIERLSELETEMQAVRERINETETRLERLALEAPQASRIEVVEAPRIPARPFNATDQAQLTLLGATGGAGLGIGMVLMLGLVDRRLRHIDQAQLDLPDARLLGVLPRLPQDLGDPEHATIAAHSIHHIRTMLQIEHAPATTNGGAHHGAAGNGHAPGRVFTVTSPGPGAGKTSLSTALGLSFASSGERTLLIDGDLVGAGLSRRMDLARHPTLAHILLRDGKITRDQFNDANGVADTRALEDVLIERGHVTYQQLEEARRVQRRTALGILDVCAGLRVTDVAVPTDVADLDLLPVGTAQPRQAGRLSPEAIRRILEQARRAYDCVIIDTGPSLGSIEASMTAAAADAAILVVSRGDRKPAITGALEHLGHVGAHVAGIVFNHASHHDIARSTYASYVSGSLDRAEHAAAVANLDPDTTARYGAVGAAVAVGSDASDTDEGHER